MKRFRSVAIVVLACFSLVAAFAALAPPSVSGQIRAAAVLVTNTEASPVPVTLQGTAPVTGTVNVGNSPTVNARQSGTWTVTNADEHGRQPYQEQVNVYSNTSHMGSGTLSIPAGKRLVVEFVSAYVGAPGPAAVAIHTEAGLYNAGAWVSVDKVRNSEVPGGWKMYFGGETVRYYAEGSLLVNVYCDAGFPWNSYVNVIGYLVDL